MSKLPTRHERAKARAALMRKYWGNAYMGDRGRDRSVATVTLAGLQAARLEAWQHGMQIGFAAAMRLRGKP